MSVQSNKKEHTRLPGAKVFIVFFLLVIISVGGIQAFVEFYREEQICAFNVIGDTFLSPHRRQRRLIEQVDSLNEMVYTLESRITEKEKNPAKISDLDLIAEELTFAVADIRKEARKINRHVDADTTGSFFRQLDTLGRIAQEYWYSFDEKQGGSGELLARIKLRTSMLSSVVGNATILDVPFRTLKHLFRYTFFNQTYLREYESALEKNSIVARACRPPMRLLRHACLGDYGDKAVAGRDGWFFYRPGVDYLVKPSIHDPRSVQVGENEHACTEDPVEAIKRFRDQLHSRGVELLVVVVPGKPSIYPDLLQEGVLGEQRNELSHSRETIEKLRDEGIEVVDLFEPFARERHNDRLAGDSLYLRTDTHWKVRGVRLAARTVARKIRRYDWFDTTGRSVEYALDTVRVDRVGDIAAMTKLTERALFGYTVKFPAEPAECHQVYTIQRDLVGDEIGRRLFRDDYRRADILVLGDSFSRIYQTDEPRSAGWISHLAYELGVPLASIVSDGGASTLVREKLARKATVLKGKRLVVWQFVERDLRYGAKGWKDVAL